MKVTLIVNSRRLLLVTPVGASPALALFEEFELLFLEEVVVLEDPNNLQEVGFLIITIGLGVADQVCEHRAKGKHGIDTLGAEQGDALFARLGILRQGGDDQQFQGCAVRPERAHCLLKHARLDKAENFRRFGQASLAENFSMPSFNHHDRSLYSRQVGRGEYERQAAGRRPGVRVQHKEVDFFVVLEPGGRDEFPVLPHQELMQLEVLPDDGFANGGHLMVEG